MTVHPESGYWVDLSQAFGAAWNRFWFEPRDPRTVSVLRIVVGILGLWYVLSHSADLVRWMGPDGILDVSTTRQLLGEETVGSAFRFSYLSFAETPASLWMLHVAGILVMVALVLGIWSRVTSVGALVVVLAYVHRAPLLAGPWEPVLTMLLAYLCLAPTGCYYSIDAWRMGRRSTLLDRSFDSSRRPGKSVAATLSTRLIQLHLAGFCIMAALNMLAADVWWNGEAVWWLITRTESRMVDLTGLAYAFPLVNLWTHGIVIYLLAFGLLVWHRLARPLLLVLGIPFWLSVALLTGLVGWCLTMLVASLAFLDPDQLHGWLSGRWRRDESMVGPA